MNKKQFSARIDEKVLEKTRDLVYWQPGLKFNKFLEDVLKAVLSQWGDKIKERPKN